MKTKGRKPKKDGDVSLKDALDWDVQKEKYVLRLYVTGMTPKSIRAIENMRAICEEYLAGRYDLEVIDVYKAPGRVRDEQIVAVPTLVRKLPLPLRRLVGDLSQKENVLIGLDLITKPEEE